MTEQQLASQFGYRAALGRAFVAAAAGNDEEAIPLLAKAGDTALRYRGSLFESDVLVGCAILAEAQGPVRGGIPDAGGGGWKHPHPGQLRRLPLVP